MKVLVTGATGQLGIDVMLELKRRNFNAIGIGSKDCDITKIDDVRDCFSKYMPEIVVHCAGYTTVDKAEDETEKCMLVNHIGTENIANICKEKSIELLYISTDYVFNGNGTEPWNINDNRQPTSVYGMSKYLGELAVQTNLLRYYIVRIPWLYGQHGNNFVKAVLNKAETCSSISVVSDQIGTPSYAVDIAKAIAEIIQSGKYGIYHVANEGYCSWYEFAQRIFDRVGKKVDVIPVSSKDYPAKAKRPLNSRLNKSSMYSNGFEALPTWENALDRFLTEYLK